LGRIERMVEAYLDHHGKVPILLLHDATSGRAWLSDHGQRLPINVLPFEVEGLGIAGAEIWLMALAFGISQVLLLDTRGITEKTRKLLQSEIEWVSTLLVSIGFGPGSVRIVDIQEMNELSLPIRPVRHLEPIPSWTQDAAKRSLIREAVEHLRGQEFAAANLALPEGSSFGAIQVDPNACTLCMKCVPVCPESALLAGSEIQQLSFVEASCIQCGGCAALCPEAAITLLPRYRFMEDPLGIPQVLAQKPAH
jgi:ferredoxin